MRRATLVGGSVVLALGAGFGAWAIADSGSSSHSVTISAAVSSSTTVAASTSSGCQSPPPGFDPTTASDTQLQAYGIPPYPGPHSDPGFQIWAK